MVLDETHVLLRDLFVILVLVVFIVAGSGHTGEKQRFESGEEETFAGRQSADIKSAAGECESDGQFESI